MKEFSECESGYEMLSNFMGEGGTSEVLLNLSYVADISTNPSYSDDYSTATIKRISFTTGPYINFECYSCVYHNTKLVTKEVNTGTARKPVYVLHYYIFSMTGNLSCYPNGYTEVTGPWTASDTVTKPTVTEIESLTIPAGSIVTYDNKKYKTLEEVSTFRSSSGRFSFSNVRAIEISE